MRPTLFEQTVLDLFRKLLFPKIVDGAITGYNIYQDREIPSLKYQINYLHSGLNEDEEGRLSPHRQELVEKLQTFGPQKLTSTIVASVVERTAVYLAGEWEENPVGISCYSEDGKLLNPKTLMDYDKPVILEGIQYDLSVGLTNQKDLNKVLAVLNKFTYNRKVSRNSRLRNEKNVNAIIDAWDIPLIILTVGTEIKRKDFLLAMELSISFDTYQGVTLLDKPELLTQYLEDRQVKYFIQPKRVNKPFVVSYLEMSC